MGDMENKRDLRKSYIDIRNSMPKASILEKSRIIAEKVIDSPFYEKCKKLFIYIDMGSEPQTREIIQRAIADGKLVAAPYAVPKSRKMFFIKIDSLDNLVKSKYGAYEPFYEEKNILNCDETTMMAVPGVVFARNGYRIGYGGGYYDTYLSANRPMIKMGVCFEESLRERVPTDAHDIQLDMLITDKSVYKWG